MSLEIGHLLFIYVHVDFNKLLENTLRFEIDLVLNICDAQLFSLACTDPRCRKCDANGI